MSMVSKVARLSPHIRAWIDRALYDAGFSDYEGLAEQLKAKGHNISKSSLHRYGVRLRARVVEAETRKLTANNGAI